MVDEFIFKYVWPDPPRTTTKAEWKAISHWLRECRRIIHKKLKDMGGTSNTPPKA